MSAIDDLSRDSSASRSVRLVDRIGAALGAGPSVSRRGFLAQTAVVGSALALDPRGYLLRPVAAYSSVCGPDSTAADGYTVFCCTVNNGVNACPPNTFTAGWWKAADSSWCCGGYRYIVDCNATCTKCTSGCTGDHICDRGCWNCSCGSGSTATCDQRRVCCNAFRYGQCNSQVSCSGGVACRVVSCVAPYHWDNCSTTSLSDDATAEHNAPCLQGCGPILTAYDSLGANGSRLGASTSTDRSVGDGRGTYVTYQQGAIYWTSSTGAYSVYGASQAEWNTLGGPRSILGYPTATRVSRSDGSWAQTFENGLICDSTATHTTSVYGASYDAYVGVGRETGILGYPTAERVSRSDGSWAQTFQNGVICDSTATHTTVVFGASYDAYVGAGRETGILGYPTGTRVTRSDTSWGQTFQNGVICDSTATHTTVVSGSIAVAYTFHGRETGPLGYPTGTAHAGRDGRGTGQSFQHGQLWALGSGRAYAVTGAVLTKWLADGAEIGKWRYPLSDVIVNAQGQQQATFEGGVLVA